MTVSPINPETEIAKLKEEIAKLQEELGKVYEIARTEASIARGKMIHAFHKLGFNHTEAVTKTTEVLGPE